MLLLSFVVVCWLLAFTHNVFGRYLGFFCLFVGQQTRLYSVSAADGFFGYLYIRWQKQCAWGQEGFIFEKARAKEVPNTYLQKSLLSEHVQMFLFFLLHIIHVCTTYNPLQSHDLSQYSIYFGFTFFFFCLFSFCSTKGRHSYATSPIVLPQSFVQLFFLYFFYPSLTLL